MDSADVTSRITCSLERRRFMAMVAVGLLAAPLVAGAQQAGTVRRIGYISNSPSSPLTEAWWGAFVAGLREQGWVEHQNIVIERRYTEQRKEAALAVAEELVRLRVHCRDGSWGPCGRGPRDLLSEAGRERDGAELCGD